MHEKYEAEVNKILKKFHISKTCGFALPDPLTSLPEYYAPWMELAANLTELIETHTLRERVMQVLPRSVAVPFCAVSKCLGLPPIIVHADGVLANWRRRDADGPMTIENLDTLVRLPGGANSRYFFLCTVMVEFAAVPGIIGLVKCVEAVRAADEATLKESLLEVAEAIHGMIKALSTMHDHVDPAVFFGVIRIFLSGWMDNPVLDGLHYEGVGDTPYMYSGGSAAQSSLLHCFDAALGIEHDPKHGSFLARMREYMLPRHSEFICWLADGPSIRSHFVSRSTPPESSARAAYNACVSALTRLRSDHIAVVTRYITVQSARARREATSPAGFALAEKGTGGTAILPFLKGVRDATAAALIE
uniref:Indoleamine 2,3-dioxygenase 2-like isoform X2 n=1 Tax=Petromyzon marinus TaxID=7757 RepID=A0AAJ7SVG8_PETMA|nr:indoleamine 2,3-dioxygenase 2-like isoform X2 [Petromyzon marinus]